jgi:hypothetical protein
MPEFGRLQGTEGFPLQLREQPGPQGGCTWIISSRNLKAFICSSRQEPFLTEMGEEEVSEENRRTFALSRPFNEMGPDN